MQLVFPDSITSEKDTLKLNRLLWRFFLQSEKNLFFASLPKATDFNVFILTILSQFHYVSEKYLRNEMFSSPSFLVLSFLISNLNPQQESAPRYPCREIRMPYYGPTKKSSRGIFIRMKHPKRLKFHCEITMAQKRYRQGCKLITGRITLKKPLWRWTAESRAQ